MFIDLVSTLVKVVVGLDFCIVSMAVSDAVVVVVYIFFAIVIDFSSFASWHFRDLLRPSAIHFSHIACFTSEVLVLTELWQLIDSLKLRYGV